jgi:hypothetical protein
LDKYFKKYNSFLNERTFYSESKTYGWTHKELRKASYSLLKFTKHLFTFKTNYQIPRTTNSLEGHFRHINEVIAIHCGLSREQKEKVLSAILLAGTISPTDEIIQKVFKKG